MLVTGFHYNVSDMDGYAESGWSRQQVEPVEPVDLSCASSAGGMSRISGYGEPLDLSTSRRPHASGYDVDQYYAHAQAHYYDASIDETQCRRWVAPPDGYSGYGAQTPYGGATCHESATPSWTNWSAYDVGIGDPKGYPVRGRAPTHCEDPGKTGPSFSHNPYPEQSPPCAFAPHHRKRDTCRFPDFAYSGYAPPPPPAANIGTGRGVYHTNGGSCKYAQSRAYPPALATETHALACPESTTSYGGRHPDDRKRGDEPGHGRPPEGASEESEGIPVFLSNCKHFAGGLVVSRKENSSPMTEVLPPISIPDFEFKSEVATDGEKLTEDDLKSVTKCPGDGETPDESNRTTNDSGDV